MDKDVPDKWTPRAPGMLIASCVVQLLAITVFALEIWCMTQGRGHKVAFFGALVALFAATLGAGLTALSVILRKGSVAADVAGAIGGVGVVVGGLVTALNGPAVLGSL